MSELLTLGTMITHQGMELLKEGACPLCYGSMEGSLAEIEHGEYVFYGFEAVCARCGMLYESSVGLSVVRHPAVVALYQDHGLDIRKQPPWTLDFVMGKEPITVIATDPLQVRVDVQPDMDELRLTVNDEALVIDIEYAE